MADEKKTNIFDLYSGKSVNAEELSETPVYQAYAFGEPEGRKFALMLYLADGTLIARTYAQFIEAMCAPPFEVLHLRFTDAVFRIEGAHLGYLVQLLNRATVEALGCYNAEFFTEATKGEPVIDSITKQSVREFLG